MNEVGKKVTYGSVQICNTASVKGGKRERESDRVRQREIQRKRDREKDRDGESRNTERDSEKPIDTKIESESFLEIKSREREKYDINQYFGMKPQSSTLYM